MIREYDGIIKHALIECIFDQQQHCLMSAAFPARQHSSAVDIASNIIVSD